MKRFRKEFGDIEGLKQSIKKVGQLHPIIKDKNGNLIAGARRLKACEELGIKPLIRVVDFDDPEQAQIDENVERKDFAPSEIYAITEYYHGRLARKTGPKTGASSCTNDTGINPRDTVAKIVGQGTATISKIKTIFESGDDALKEKVDAGKTSVDRAYKEIKREVAREENKKLIEQIKPLPDRKYKTIVIDPPWSPEDEGDVDQFGRGQPTYQTLTLQQLLEFPIESRADKNAHLYLFITNRSLPKGFQLIEKWGFRYVTCLTWTKPSFAMGNYFRGQTEHILFGVRGSLPLLRQDVGTWINAPRQKQHSQKPEEIYDLIQSCSPGPWIDIFARRQRKGWDCWGAEV